MTNTKWVPLKFSFATLKLYFIILKLFTFLVLTRTQQLFHLEEMLDRKDHDAIVRIQKAFRNWKAKRHAIEQRAWAADLLRGKKERRRASVDIKYTGDYLSVETNPGIMEAMQEYSMLLFEKKICLVCFIC